MVSSPLLKYTVNSVSRIIVYSYGLHATPPIKSPDTRKHTGLTSRRLLEFK